MPHSYNGCKAGKQDAMEKKKAIKKSGAKRNAIPYTLIAKLAQEGADAMAIARRIGRLNDGSDKTHTVRAILSQMRSRGWRDAEGKLHKLKVARVGQAKKSGVKTKGSAKKSNADRKGMPKQKAVGSKIEAQSASQE